jgi:hypothetical protein
MRYLLISAAMLLSLTGNSLSQGNPQSDAQQKKDPGPINTQSKGGAPAASPQGETPPGMQSNPQGSGKAAPPGQTEKKK